jgi:hypothetical protein
MSDWRGAKRISLSCQFVVRAALFTEASGRTAYRAAPEALRENTIVAAGRETAVPSSSRCCLHFR